MNIQGLSRNKPGEKGTKSKLNLKFKKVYYVWPTVIITKPQTARNVDVMK